MSDSIMEATTPDWVLPAGLELPRLEAVMGCRLRDLTWDTLQRFVDNGTREDLSLDFKATLYGDDEKGSFELPKDVASFANAAGGLIVVGMGDKAGVATGFSHTTPSDATKRDMMNPPGESGDFLV